MGESSLKSLSSWGLSSHLSLVTTPFPKQNPTKQHNSRAKWNLNHIQKNPEYLLHVGCSYESISSFATWGPEGKYQNIFTPPNGWVWGNRAFRWTTKPYEVQPAPGRRSLGTNNSGFHVRDFRTSFSLDLSLRFYHANVIFDVGQVESRLNHIDEMLFFGSSGSLSSTHAALYEFSHPIFQLSHTKLGTHPLRFSNSIF